MHRMKRERCELSARHTCTPPQQHTGSDSSSIVHNPNQHEGLRGRRHCPVGAHRTRPAPYVHADKAGNSHVYLVHKLDNNQLQNVVERLHLVDARRQVIQSSVLVNCDQHDEGISFARGILHFPVQNTRRLG